MNHLRHSVLLTCFLLLLAASAEATDTLYAGMRNGRMFALHAVRKEESLYTIAQTYSVPAMVLSQNNDISFYDKLSEGQMLVVPLGNYNFYDHAANGTSPLYYKAAPQESRTAIAQALGISIEALQKMNPEGQTPVLIGWISYSAPQKESTPSTVVPASASSGTNPTANAGKPVPPAPPSELEKIYRYQTTNEEYLDSASGMVVFFKPQTAVNNTLLYAFSNDVRKGRVIKIINPSNQKFVYAKVIGALPATRQYTNARLGVDGRARDLLETREIKLWCNLYFKY